MYIKKRTQFHLVFFGVECRSLSSPANRSRLFDVQVPDLEIEFGGEQLLYYYYNTTSTLVRYTGTYSTWYTHLRGGMSAIIQNFNYETRPRTAYRAMLAARPLLIALRHVIFRAARQGASRVTVRKSLLSLASSSKCHTEC